MVVDFAQAQQDGGPTSWREHGRLLGAVVHDGVSFLFLLSFSDLSLPMLKVFILFLSLSTVEQIMSRERTSSSLYRQAAGYG